MTDQVEQFIRKGVLDYHRKAAQTDTFFLNELGKKLTVLRRDGFQPPTAPGWDQERKYLLAKMQGSLQGENAVLELYVTWDPRFDPQVPMFAVRLLRGKSDKVVRLKLPPSANANIELSDDCHYVKMKAQEGFDICRDFNDLIDAALLPSERSNNF